MTFEANTNCEGCGNCCNDFLLFGGIEEYFCGHSKRGKSKMCRILTKMSN